jgi:hypothetical protein
MLNKQANDPDVAGVGPFVEENFYNLGLADHPLQALNAVARNDPNFRDDRRREIAARDSDACKFRVLTLRQLKDARFAGSRAVPAHRLFQLADRRRRPSLEPGKLAVNTRFSP